MSKEQMYTQCRLERPQDDGTKLWDEVWIPTQFAVVGKRISLKKGDDWQDGWSVLIKGVTRTESWLKEHERDWLRQRRASDKYRKDGHWETVS